MSELQMENDIACGWSCSQSPWLEMSMSMCMSHRVQWPNVHYDARPSVHLPAWAACICCWEGMTMKNEEQ